MVARLPLGEIRVGKRYRKKVGNLDKLKKSILENGLIHPIAITKSNMLVAGRRRLEVFKELAKESKDFEEIPVSVLTLEDIRKGEREENIQREDFTAEELAEIVLDLLPEEVDKAKGREESGKSLDGQAGGRGKKKPKVKLTQGLEGKAIAVAGNAVGWSQNTAKKAVAIIEAVRKAPKKFAKVLEQLNKSGKVSGAYRELKKMIQIEEIAKEPPPLPKGPFRVIAIDPPWKYDNRADDPSHRAANPYPSLPIDEIDKWPIGDLAHEDSVLWLWTTNAHLEQAFGIARAWGFKYKTLLTWVKNKMGTGDWLRGKTEHCLFCVRGKPTINLTNQTTVINGDMRKHSQKPEEFFAMVEALCPGSKVEIFSRERRQGWETFGDEI